jgi:hypothetical protein
MYEFGGSPALELAAGVADGMFRGVHELFPSLL